jgi:hypothetical protein
MPSRFVSVPAETLEGFLSSKGFVRGITGNEVHYDRINDRNPKIKVRVFTSISSNAVVARECGKDAIRVVVLADDGTKWVPLVKDSPRIYRTGSVEKILERVLMRAREAYAMTNDYSKKKCVKCGACTYPDSGRCIVRECRDSWKTQR